MYILTTLMEDDNLRVVAQQVFLYLPLTDMLEFMYVCKLWCAHIQTLFRRDSSRWLHTHFDRKMSGVANSATSGSVVQKVHRNEHYQELIEYRGYVLLECDLFQRLVLLSFGKTEEATGKNKYWFYAIAQDNVHKVQYSIEFVGTFGHHFVYNDSIVIWWYNLASNDQEGSQYLNIDYIVIDDLIHFSEKFYTTTALVSDFVSPLVALHELLSGDTSLRSAIKMQFPVFNYHKQLTRRTSMNVAVSTFRNHEIFYPTKPGQEASELWVIPKCSMKVEFKQSTCRNDWGCRRKNDLPKIDLQGYSPPIALFHIVTSNTFAIWDLSRPGHPRHVGFDVELPRGPWLDVNTHSNKSKWFIGVSESGKTTYIHLSASSTRLLRNSLEACECNGVDVQQQQQQQHSCRLQQNKQILKADSISYRPRLRISFIGDRYLIQTPWDRSVNIIDCWQLPDD